MAYPKYTSIKYSGKSPEQLLEKSDWMTEAFQGIRTWQALTQEVADRKYEQWQRKVTKENYTLSAMDSVLDLAKSQPNDAAVFDDSLRELNRIMENTTVSDPKTSALVTKGRIARNYLTRERAEIAVVQQTAERINDRNVVFTKENIYNQVNEPGWDPSSGEKSTTEKLIDDAHTWLNEEQRELERMNRYDGSMKEQIVKLRNEYDAIKSYIGHDGKITKQDMAAAELGFNIKQIYDEKIKESFYFQGQVAQGEGNLAALQIKQQKYIDQVESGVEAERLSEYFLSPEEAKMLTDLPFQIDFLKSQQKDVDLWIRKNRFDATGEGGQYIERDDPYGATNIMSKEQYDISGRKPPIIDDKVFHSYYTADEPDIERFEETLPREMSDYSNIKLLGGEKDSGIEDTLSKEDIKEIEDASNIENFSQIVGSIDFKSGYIFDESGKRIKNKDGDIAKVPLKTLKKFRGKVTEGHILQSLDKDVQGISIDLKSGNISVSEDSELSKVLSDEFDFEGKEKKEISQIKNFAGKYEKLVTMYNQETTNKKKKLLLEKQIRAYDKRLNKLLK